MLGDSPFTFHVDRFYALCVILRMSMIVWKGKERPDSPALRVVMAFGGLVELAKALDVPVSTVQGWLERGVVPPRHQRTILDRAAGREITLDPLTFVPGAMPELASAEAL
jgi:hypothetical protein